MLEKKHGAESLKHDNTDSFKKHGAESLKHDNTETIST